ncbi:Fe2+-dependent dioxygenase [Tropicimonas sp. IMCC6043]|uniref:Fe2+-dependent dioxygenase n=1 Tax=Tropicimonas sp. IMCC6043 TaxID=2510645 RepID=UPI0013EABCF1|nr:Fe2+-dependent dioxygenase [Tropicimonas sp. IMCC6043]
MAHVIGGVVDAHEVSAMRQAIEALEFEDGRHSAGRYARGVKSNEQAAATPGRDAIFATLRKALNANALFVSVARPRKFARMLISRYGPGMEYGTHVDDPIMQGSRTDLSFTLFLSAADSYDGGGLVLEDPLEDRVFRLEPGDMILYPTSALHRVEPVTRGTRLAVVGWVTSWVREADRREVLHDLDLAARSIFDAQGKTPAFDRLLKAKSNLFRMWAEG